MFTAKITSKGQVTIPKKIRMLLNSSVIGFTVEKGIVKVIPVDRVEGSLAKYRKRPARSVKDIRSAVWKEVARDKA